METKFRRRRYTPAFGVPLLVSVLLLLCFGALANPPRLPRLPRTRLTTTAEAEPVAPVRYNQEETIRSPDRPARPPLPVIPKERPLRAQDIARSELSRTCAANGCQHPSHHIQEATVIEGKRMTEGAEGRCTSCGAEVGAERSLSLTSSDFGSNYAPTTRVFQRGEPRGNPALSNKLRSDLPQPKPLVLRPPIVETKPTDQPRRVSQRLATKGLSAVCPRVGGTCPREQGLGFKQYTRGTKITVGGNSYDASSARCGVFGCGATAEGTVGSDGSQTIAARRKDVFYQKSGGPEQRDPVAARRAAEAASLLRKGNNKK